MTPQERKVMELALEALKYHTAQTRPIHQTDKAIIAINEALAKQGQIETQIGEIIKSLRCPNCDSLERQNAELDLRLVEQEQPPFGFLTNKRQRITFEQNAKGLSNMPMTVDWTIPLYSSPPLPKEPEQEPVAWIDASSFAMMNQDPRFNRVQWQTTLTLSQVYEGQIPFYTTPPQPQSEARGLSQSNPLTNAQYFEIGQRHWLPSVKVEQIHKELEEATRNIKE